MSLVDQAVALGERGYYVLPLIVRSDGRKIPLIKWGKNASTQEDVIRGMETAAGEPAWEEATHVAVACEPTGIVVVDVDTFYDDDQERLIDNEDDLVDEWRDLAELHGEDPVEVEEGGSYTVFDPPYVITARNGIHFFLKANPALPVATTAKEISHCIDTRGVGGQHGGIVAIYVPDHMPDIDALPPVPAWLSELTKARLTRHATPEAEPVEPQFAGGEAGTEWGCKELERRLRLIRKLWDDDDGHFNDKLVGLAYGVGQVAGGGELDDEHAHTALIDLLQELGAPPDQYKTIDSGYSFGFKHPLTASAAKSKVLSDESIDAMAKRWISGTALDMWPEPRWLIDGWLELDSVAQMYGEPGVGKSFIALDIACRVSRGMGWPERGNANGPLPVAYVVAEGVAGLAQRKRAWEHAHGRIGDMKFYPEALQIIGNERDHNWDLAVEFLAQWSPALIIIDTQARCTLGVDENKPVEMGTVIDKIDALQKRTNACVLLVHHTAKGGSTARGTNAMKGALASELMIGKHYGRIRVRNTKQKNAVESDDAYFCLEESGPESVIPKLTISVPGAMAESVQRSNVKMLIRQFLQEHPDVPQTTKEIMEAVGSSRANLSTALNEMADANEIMKSTVSRNSRQSSAYLWNPPVSPA